MVIVNYSQYGNSEIYWTDDTSQPEHILIHDLFVISIWTVLGLFGIITNLLTIAGINQNRKLRHCTSYWLVTSLAFCDAGMLMVCLAHLIPASILHDRYMKLIDISNAFGVFVYDAFWYTGVLHLMFMSINRYVNICRPKQYHRLFARGTTIIVILILYLFGTGLACPGLFPCCYLVYNSDLYAAQYVPIDTPYRYMDMVINGSSVLVMALCYVAIVQRVRRSRIMLHQYRKFCKEQTKTALAYAKTTTQARRNSVSAKLTRLLRRHAPIASRRELRLFFQFATVSFIFFLTFFTWSWLPHLATNSKWMGFAVTSLFFINNSINPVIYFIFNSTLWRQIQKMVCPSNSPTNGASERKNQRGRGQQENVTETRQNSNPSVTTEALRVKPRVSVLRRLRSSASMKQGKAGENYRKQRRRRSTAFDLEEHARQVRVSYDSSVNESIWETEAEGNATCNLIAMAAFLNTTTITGGVLIRAIQEDDEKRKILLRQMLIGGGNGRRDDDEIKNDQNGENGKIAGHEVKEIHWYGKRENGSILMDEEDSIHL